MSYLDIDDVRSGSMTEIPKPTEKPLPGKFSELKSKSGTLVCWKKCERLDFSSVNQAEKQLPGFLGRVYRYFLLGGRKVTLNATELRPIDPLFLDERCEHKGAQTHGTPIELDVPVPNNPRRTSRVVIRFSLYPEEWQHLGANKGENRLRGIVRLRGISMVRASREIDHEYFGFIAPQHGYDNWWGAEIRFEPELDELFGVTHTKQQVHLNQEIRSRLESHITGNVNTLRDIASGRKGSRQTANASAAEQVAKAKERQLRAIEGTASPEAQTLAIEQAELYAKEHAREGEDQEEAKQRALQFPYILELEHIPEGPFYRPIVAGPTTYVYLNTDHPFYTEVYAPLSNSEAVPGAKLGVELLLFALARAERQSGEDMQDFYRHQRIEWSTILRVYLSD